MGVALIQPRPVGLSAPVEPDAPVSHVLDAPSRFVGAVVVTAAEQDSVVEVGAAAVVPGVEVVGLAPGAGDVAALGAAGAVPHQKGLSLGGGEEAAGPAEVDWKALPAEDDRKDPRGAGKAPSIASGDPVSWEVVTRDEPRADQVRGGEVGAQRVERDGDDNRGRIAPVDREP